MNSRLAPATRLQRLHPGARLWGAREACLPQRFPDVACAACVDECPVAALSIGAEGFRLSGDCHDCGRCTAACPTQALSIGNDGFEAPDAIDAALAVECERVPAELTATGTLRVRCTAALSVGRLLALAEKALGKGGVQIVDRGWCADCKAGGGTCHPAAARIETASGLLEQAGVPDIDRISVVARPLPIALRQDELPEARTPSAVDRRGFLRHLLGHSAAIVRPEDAPETIGDAQRPDGRARILPAERVSCIATLSRMTQATGQPLPASLFWSATVSARCCNHQVCTKVCPVDALQVQESEAWNGLAFNAALCIGCAACERSCPEGALHVAAPDPDRAGNGIFMLTSHRTQSCFDCGTTFVERGERPDDATPTCPACRKSQELGRSLFAGLF